MHEAALTYARKHDGHPTVIGETFANTVQQQETCTHGHKLVDSSPSAIVINVAQRLAFPKWDPKTPDSQLHVGGHKRLQK